MEGAKSGKESECIYTPIALHDGKPDEECVAVEATVVSLPQSQPDNKSRKSPLNALSTFVSNTGVETITKTTREMHVQTTANTAVNTFSDTTAAIGNVTMIATNGLTTAYQPTIAVFEDQSCTLVTQSLNGAKIIDGTLKMPIQRLSPHNARGKKTPTPMRKLTPSYGQGNSGNTLSVPGSSSELQRQDVTQNVVQLVGPHRSSILIQNSGNVTGSITGNMDGSMTGCMTGSVTGSGVLQVHPHALQLASPVVSAVPVVATANVARLPVKNIMKATSPELSKRTQTALPEQEVTGSRSSVMSPPFVSARPVVSMSSRPSDAVRPIERTTSSHSSLSSNQSSKRQAISLLDVHISPAVSCYPNVGRNVATAAQRGTQQQQPVGQPSIPVTQLVTSHNQVMSPDMQQRVVPRVSSNQVGPDPNVGRNVATAPQRGTQQRQPVGQPLIPVTQLVTSRNHVMSPDVQQRVVPRVSSNQVGPDPNVGRNVATTPQSGTQQQQPVGQPSIPITQLVTSRNHVMSPDVQQRVVPCVSSNQVAADPRKVVQSVAASHKPTETPASGLSQVSVKRKEQKLGQQLAAAIGCQATVSKSTTSPSVMAAGNRTTLHVKSLDLTLEDKTALRAKQYPPFRPNPIVTAHKQMVSNQRPQQMVSNQKPQVSVISSIVGAPNVSYIAISSVTHSGPNVPLTGVYRRMVGPKSQRQTQPTTVVTTAVKKNSVIELCSGQTRTCVAASVATKASNSAAVVMSKCTDNSTGRTVGNVNSTVTLASDRVAPTQRVISNVSSQQSVHPMIMSAGSKYVVSKRGNSSEPKSPVVTGGFQDGLKPTVLKKTVGVTRAPVSQSGLREMVKTVAHTKTCEDTKCVVSDVTYSSTVNHSKCGTTVTLSGSRPANLVVQRMTSGSNPVIAASSPVVKSQMSGSISTGLIVSTLSSVVTSSVPISTPMSAVIRVTNNGMSSGLKATYPPNCIAHLSDSTRQRVQSHIKSKSSETSQHSPLTSVASHSSLDGSKLQGNSMSKDVSGKGPPPLIKTSPQSSGSNLVEKSHPYQAKPLSESPQVESVGSFGHRSRKRGSVDVTDNMLNRKAAVRDTYGEEWRTIEEARSGYSSFHVPVRHTEFEIGKGNIPESKGVAHGKQVSRKPEYEMMCATSTGSAAPHSVFAMSSTGSVASRSLSQIPIIDLTDSPNCVSSSLHKSQQTTKVPKIEPQEQTVGKLSGHLIGAKSNAAPISCSVGSRAAICPVHNAPHMQQHVGMLSSMRHSSAQMGYQPVLSVPHMSAHQQHIVMPSMEAYSYEYPQDVYMPPMVGHPHIISSQQRAMPHLIMPTFQHVPLHSTLLSTSPYPIIQGSPNTMTSWSPPSVVMSGQLSESLPALEKNVKPLIASQPQSEQKKPLLSPVRPRLLVREPSVEQKVSPVVMKGEKDDSFEEVYVDVSKDAQELHSKEKLEFMASLGLITPRKFSEIRDKRAQRKRRARTISSTLASASLRAKRTRPVAQPGGLRRGHLRSNRLVLSGSQSLEDGHGDVCAVCQVGGKLLMCDTCSLVYHLDCLVPPLAAVPPGTWICPQCLKQLSNADSLKWSGTLSVVQSYFTHRSECETERKALLDKIESCKSERIQLEETAKEMSTKIIEQMQLKSALTSQTEQLQTSLQQLHNSLNGIKKSAQAVIKTQC